MGKNKLILNRLQIKKKLMKKNGVASVIEYALTTRDTLENNTLIGKIYYISKLGNTKLGNTGIVVVESKEKIILLLKDGKLSNSTYIRNHQYQGEISNEGYEVILADNGKSFELKIRDKDIEKSEPKESDEPEPKESDEPDEPEPKESDEPEPKESDEVESDEPEAKDDVRSNMNTSNQFPSVVTKLNSILLQRKQESPSDIIDAYFELKDNVAYH